MPFLYERKETKKEIMTEQRKNPDTEIAEGMQNSTGVEPPKLRATRKQLQHTLVALLPWIRSSQEERDKLIKEHVDHFNRFDGSDPFNVFR